MIDNVYFQQETIDLLIKKCERVISRRNDDIYPMRSCALTPFEFYLWGHVKDNVFDNSPASIEDLKYGMAMEVYRGHRAATLRI